MVIDCIDSRSLLSYLLLLISGLSRRMAVLPTDSVFSGLMSRYTNRVDTHRDVINFSIMICILVQVSSKEASL